MEVLNQFSAHGYKVGSVNITTSYNKKDNTLSKDAKFSVASWTNNEPVIKTGYNGYYMRTGEYNNVIVLDLDNMLQKECKMLKKMADKCADTIVQTRKGFHYYFPYDKDFSKTIHFKKSYNVDFDIQSNGAYVYCPPTIYMHHENGEKYEYKVLKFDDAHKNKPMSKKLKAYIMGIMNKTTTQTPTTTPTTSPQSNTNVEYQQSNDIIIRLINGLNKKRSIETDSWMKAGFAFKSEGYDSSYFHYFSKLHYANYSKSDVENFYLTKIKSKNKDEKRITIGTLWMWLKEDNKDLYKTLAKENLFEKTQIDLDKYKTFSISQLTEFVIKDNAELGYYYDISFEMSRSFKYFNKFHFYYVPHALIYKITEDGLLPYPKINIFPNLETFSGKPFELKYIEEISIRLIDDLVFNPNPKFTPNVNQINLFTGFKFQRTEPTEEIDPFINHIKSLLNDREIEYNYVLDWIASIFQKPHRKTGTAVVLYSDTQGSGKNIIFDTLGKVLGKYYLKLQSSTDFAQRFNSQFQNKLMIVGDEIDARMKDKSNELKDVITRVKINIEFKGKETFTIDDFGNYVFTTNNENVFKVSITDRRMAIFHTIEKKISKKVIDAILKIQEDDNLLAQLMTYFLNRDISKFVVSEIPMTEHKTDLVKMDLPAYFKVILDSISSYTDEKFTAKDLYKMSVDYAKQNNLTRTYTERKCSLDLSKVLGKYYKRVKDERFYILDKKDEEDINTLINTYIKTKGE